MLDILFTKVYVTSKEGKLKNKKNELTKIRQPDEILNQHYTNACNYFEGLADSFLPLKEFADTSDSSAVVKKYRHLDGGNVLFRPIGLKIFTEIIAVLVETHSLSDCFKLISKLPTDLTKIPYNGIIWHPTQKKILTTGKTLVKHLLLYMLNQSPEDVNKLQEDYAKALGVETNQIGLPEKVL